MSHKKSFLSDDDAANLQTTIGKMSKARMSDRYSRRDTSRRLTILEDMLERYSNVETRRSSVISSTLADEEIHRLQWIVATNLPNLSGILVPDDWAEVMRPRKTIAELESNLNDIIARAPRMSIVNTPIDNFVRNVAIKKLEADTFKKLQIIYNNHCSFLTKLRVDMPSFSPFGWTFEEFTKRRLERNTVWLEILLALNEKDLEMLKFKCDLEELFNLLRLLFQGEKQDDDDAKENLFEFIHDAYEFLKFPRQLKAESKLNMTRLHEQVNTYLDMLNFKRGPEEEAYKISLEQKIVDLSVVGPIELRYEVNWMNTKTDQAILKITNALDDMEKQANSYRKEEFTESYCARSVLDMYYMDIDKYKRQIAELSEKYETELEKAENDISYKKLSMDKLRDQRKFCEDEIKRFEEEIEELFRKQLEEQMLEEERKRNEELMAQEKALQKAIKDKKAKGKK